MNKDMMDNSVHTYLKEKKKEKILSYNLGLGRIY